MIARSDLTDDEVKARFVALIEADNYQPPSPGIEALVNCAKQAAGSGPWGELSG